MGWAGFAACEEGAVVVPFLASHKDRRGAIAAAERLLESWGLVASACEAWREDSAQGERFEEAAQLYARDRVTGCDGIDEGYEVLPVERLEPADRGAGAVAQARGNGIGDAELKRILSAYMAVERAHEAAEVEHDFLALVESMGNYYN